MENKAWAWNYHWIDSQFTPYFPYTFDAIVNPKSTRFAIAFLMCNVQFGEWNCCFYFVRRNEKLSRKRSIWFISPVTFNLICRLELQLRDSSCSKVWQIRRFFFLLRRRHHLVLLLPLLFVKCAKNLFIHLSLVSFFGCHSMFLKLNLWSTFCRTFLHHRKTSYSCISIFSLTFIILFNVQCSLSIHYHALGAFSISYTSMTLKNLMKHFYDSSLVVSEMQFDRKYLHFVRFQNCWTEIQKKNI